MTTGAAHNEDAKAVYQAWLDETAEAVMTGDVDACLKFVSLPYLFSNHETRVVIETREDLAHGVERLASSMRAFGVNQFIRLATDAEFLSTDYLQGHHVTHMLRNTTYMVPSFINRVVLRRGNTAWKVTEYVTGVPDGYWPADNEFGKVKPGLPEPLDTDDARREAQDPLAVYQRFLNQMTRANVSRNFDAFLKLIQLPFTGHGMNFDEVVDTEEKARANFDALSERLRNNQVEEFLRCASHAEFLSGDTLCGYHNAMFLRDGKEAIPPINSRMVLHRTGTKWRLKSVTNSVANEKLIPSEPIIPGDLVTQREIQERTK